MGDKNSSELADNGKRILPVYGANSYIIKREYNADELAKLGHLSFNIDFAGGPENYLNSLSDRKSEIAERIKSGETTITQESNRLDEIKNQKELVLWTLFLKGLYDSSLPKSKGNVGENLVCFLGKKEDLENNYIVGGEWWKL